MQLINPNDTTHNINFIPRYFTTGVLELFLYNENTQLEVEVNNTYVIVDGYLSLTFDFNFSESERFQFKLSESNKIVYRGKLIATSQETQENLNDYQQYFYE